VATPEGSDRSSTPQQQTYTRVQGTALIASRLRLLTGYQPNPE
jgi:hypothetical protein